jgi:hypothetical protein
MTRTIFATGGAVALAATITLGAQTPPPPTQRPAPPSPGTTVQADPDRVTVTGCLKVWDPATTGLPPGPANGRFLLTNVETTASDSTTAGSAAAPTPPSAQYIVTASSGVNLMAHVNHKVRIAGTAMPTFAPEPVPADATPAPRPGAAGTPSPGAASTWKALNATSVSMVSATCPTATN